MKAACGNLEVANTLVGDTLLVAILIIDFFRNMKAGEDRTYQVLLRLTIRQSFQQQQNSHNVNPSMRSETSAPEYGSDRSREKIDNVEDQSSKRKSNFSALP